MGRPICLYKSLLSDEANTVPLDSECNCTGIVRPTMSYWSEDPLHQGNGLLLGWSSGVCISDICAAAGWSSPSMFARFDNVFALNAWILSVWGLDYGVLEATKSFYDLISGAYLWRFWLLLAEPRFPSCFPWD